MENNEKNYSARDIPSASTKNVDGQDYEKNRTIFDTSRKFVRIEYPGIVQNVENAIRTLNGIHAIEQATGNMKPLELRFHPDNSYNKPCIGDKDSNPGILLKITHNDDNNDVKYEVVGVVTTNIKFNRLCDFQLLPIVSKKDDCEAEGEMIYHKVCPKTLPTLKWFVSKEISEQPRFYVPQTFSRFDAANYSIYLNPGEKFHMFSNSIRPQHTSDSLPTAKKKHIPAQKMSSYLPHFDANTRIPDKPKDFVLTIIERRGLEDKYEEIKKMFEERPIWTKVAIQYTMNITNELAKILLPSVAYYCPLGPWRTCWVRFGYNVYKEFGSRIYQTLDYRIRSGVEIKVLPKRASVRYHNSQNEKLFTNEKCFILKPKYVPPARQMFYQYCDIYIPEIQDMLQRLPKVPLNAKFDPKNGWFPASFQDQCREIVSKYVSEAVYEEFRKNPPTDQEHEKEVPDEQEAVEEEDKPITYCSKMLSDIKKGIYKSNIIPLKDIWTPSDTPGTSKVVEFVDLVEDLTQDANGTDDPNNEIPEATGYASDEEISEGSDMEIDAETAEEINEIIHNTKKTFQPFNLDL